MKQNDDNDCLFRKSNAKLARTSLTICSQNGVVWWLPSSRMLPLGGRFVFGELGMETFQKNTELNTQLQLRHHTAVGFSAKLLQRETESGAQMLVTSHQNPPHLALAQGPSPAASKIFRRSRVTPDSQGPERIPQEINGHPWEAGTWIGLDSSLDWGWRKDEDDG